MEKYRMTYGKRQGTNKMWGLRQRKTKEVRDARDYNSVCTNTGLLQLKGSYI